MINHRISFYNCYFFPPINLDKIQIIKAIPANIKIKAHHIPALKTVLTASQLVNIDNTKTAKNPRPTFFIFIKY